MDRRSFPRGCAYVSAGVQPALAASANIEIAAPVAGAKVPINVSEVVRAVPKCTVEVTVADVALIVP